MENSQPWGFRLKGGSQQGMPLFVEHVGPKGRAAHAGLQAGDVIVEICKTPMTGKSHDDAKREMLRAGNDLDLLVERGGMAGGRVAQPAPAAVAAPAGGQQEQRVQVIEEPTMKMGGPTYKAVQPKTYKVLEAELGPQPTEQAAAPPQGAPRPASIFDRKREERSGYLKAGPQSTIQKAYGQNH